MNPEDLKKLQECCEVFQKFRKNEVTGDGDNLHDIKHSFDYVRKYADQNGLTGTVFFGELAEKAKNAGNVLSELWLCFRDLENAVNEFVSNQTNLNNRG